MHVEWFGDNKAYSLAGTEQEVRFIIDVLNLPKDARILDLYCGYGRHAIELVKHGYDVVGFDATESFLDIARKNARSQNVDIELIVGDMREIPQNMEFDAVINMFAAFGYFTDEENASIIRRIGQILKPGGRFLIDLLNREWMAKNTLNRYWRHPNGEYVLSFKVDLRGGISWMKRTLVNQVDDTKTEYEFALRAYSRPEMEALITAAGLNVVSVYGGFDKRAYGIESPRMIVLAEKPL